MKPYKLVLSLAALGLAASLSGCAHGMRADRSVSASVVAENLSPRADRAVALLGEGETELARAELNAALKKHPKDKVARRLLTEMDAEPEAILGASKYPYRARRGETMWMLADRFLGDPLLFYVLARYNGVEAPDSLYGGQVIWIPAQRPDAARIAAATQPAKDPARAENLRKDARQRLSVGEVDRAVSMLREAVELSPANVALREEFDQAVRIQHAVARAS